jgi:DNA-binding NarL/FixJ family response regulator
MKGGTLVVSRAENLHDHFKQRFEALGFTDVTVTGCEKDALVSKIRELKPSQVFIGARFNHGATAYMIRELIKFFKKLNVAVVSLCDDYPAELGMACIVNGAKSFLRGYDGLDEFYRGIAEVREGKPYISPAVQKRIDLRRDFPPPAKILTARQIEIGRLLCAGFYHKEIGDTLHCSKRTIDNQSTRIFNSLNCRTNHELLRAALQLGIYSQEEIDFYSKDFVISPLPEEKLLIREGVIKSDRKKQKRRV